MNKNEKRVYNFGVPTAIYVQIRNVPQPARVEAETVEEDRADLVLKKGGEVVGKIERVSVIGWWKQDE
jgi:hypothetical protein